MFGNIDKNFTDDWRFDWIRNNIPKVFIKCITKCAMASGKFSVPQFFTNRPLQVVNGLHDVVACAATFHSHEDAGILRQVTPHRGSNFRNYPLLEQPADSALINWISAEAVYIPSQDCIRFTFFDAVEHGAENWTSWIFGALSFFERVADKQSLPFCELAEFGGLGVKANDLMGFVVCALADVEKK